MWQRRSVVMSTMLVSASLAALMGCGRSPVTAGGFAPGPGAGADGPAGMRGSASAAVPSASPVTGSAGQRVSPRDYQPIAALRPVHFDYDRSDVRAEDLPVLDRNAGWMAEHPAYRILIEGHADERGTSEYNLALGDRRARSTMNYLVSKGVRATRISIVSYGEERPVCGESTAACWARNRRAAFLVAPE